MANDWKHWQQKATAQLPANKKWVRSLKKKWPQDFDQVAAELTKQAYEKIDCLSCGNCCRSLGPRLTNKDIQRMAKYLKMRPAEFTHRYLRVDEDGDFVFQHMPCPFLGNDNYCAIYDIRPKACREFPHTDQRKVHQVMALTVKNTLICPIAFEVMDGLRAHYQNK